MRRIFFVLLIAAVAYSCGAQPTTQDDASRREDPGRRTPEAETAAEEITFPEAEQTPEETTAPNKPARVAEREPEPRDGPASTNTATEPAVGTNGMVSSAHPLATRAGLEVLEDGGNAFDAAVAVGAALNVVEPMMGGVGGYGTFVLYDAESGEVRAVDANSRVPAALDADAFYPPTPGYLGNRRSAKSVITPGVLHVWEKMHAEYGELGWRRLFEPAVSYAEDGFEVGDLTAFYIEAEFDAFPEHAREIYGNDGAPLQAGERLVQKDLADSFRRIAERGPGAMYEGELGEAMASEVRENGGYLAVEDLRSHRAAWRETLSIDYRGDEVLTAGLPTGSWNGLLRLGVMSRFDPAALGAHNSADYLHAYAEVTKRAYEERFRYAGDPEETPPPVDELLSERYWEEVAAGVDPYAASGFAKPASVFVEGASAGTADRASVETAQGHTTHFVVADGEGNVVSATQTLGNLFGSRVMAEGTGIWLNDSLAWAPFDPRGAVPEIEPGDLRGGGLFPAFVMRDDGRPRVAIGTPGGYTITQTVPQMLMNLLDFDMDVQRAIAAPRISFFEPYWLAVEGSLPASVRDELAARGHAVSVDDPTLGNHLGLGNAHGLTIEYGAEGRPTRFTGGADPRGRGVASGL